MKENPIVCRPWTPAKRESTEKPRNGVRKGTPTPSSAFLLPPKSQVFASKLDGFYTLLLSLNNLTSLLTSFLIPHSSTQRTSPTSSSLSLSWFSFYSTYLMLLHSSPTKPWLLFSVGFGKFLEKPHSGFGLNFGNLNLSGISTESLVNTFIGSQKFDKQAWMAHRVDRNWMTQES